jgi:hypothetical protein
VNAWAAFDYVERTVLFIGSLLCAGVCLGLGSLLGIPREPGFSGSLLASNPSVPAIMVAGVSIAICIVIGSVVAALVEAEAGLFCCCMGLAALGVRCGPIRPVLQFAQGRGVLMGLSIETAILGVLLAGIWFVSRRILDKNQSAEDLQSRVAPNEVTDATLLQKFGTLAVQVIGMALCEQILIQTDRQPQAMAGVMISGFAGSLVAYMFRPLSEGIWYWTGPAVLGVVGYLLAFFTSDGIAIGDLHGWAGPLARPTPLIYISMGTAGALVGYWCSRRWAQPEDDGEQPALAVNS